MPEASIGVTIVSGFLGSGKTTLLRRIVRDPKIGPRAAVIVNEIGELGLDEAIIRTEQASTNLQVRQLLSGCLCCTLRGDLAGALIELASRPPEERPAHVVIEPSGAARASEISYGVNAIGYSVPFHTEAVITLVDGRNLGRALRESPELFEDQVRSADIVLINKRDLVPEEERGAIEARVRGLAPRATVTWTEQAGVDVGLLLGVGVLPGEDGRGRGRGYGYGYGYGHAHAHDHGHNHDFRAVVIEGEGVFDRVALEDALVELAETVFRIKGVVDVDEPGRGRVPMLVQVVGDRVDLDFLPEGSPLAAFPRRLIFIGLAPDQEGIEEALSTCRRR